MFTRFSGHAEALSLDAEVTTGALGADYQWRGGVRAGVLMVHSRSEGAYAAYTSEGTTHMQLTGTYPYVSYGGSSVRMWALAGWARGAATVVPAAAAMRARLLAGGAVGTLASRGRSRLKYEADLFVVRAAGVGYPAVGVHRLRAGVEGSWAWNWGIRPWGLAALRWDGGAAETGLGLEMGGGLRWMDMVGRWRAEVSSRGLVTHAVSGLSEWGWAASVQYGGRQGLGPMVEVRPMWGAGRSGGPGGLVAAECDGGRGAGRTGAAAHGGACWIRHPSGGGHGPGAAGTGGSAAGPGPGLSAGVSSAAAQWLDAIRVRQRMGDRPSMAAGRLRPQRTRNPAVVRTCRR